MCIRDRRVDCVELIDGIAILRDFAVPDHASVVGFLGHDGRWCVGKYGRAGTDQPEMVEERAPERGHKEIVGERELLGELPELSLAPIVVPHDHTCLLYTSPSPRDRTRYRMPSS